MDLSGQTPQFNLGTNRITLILTSDVKFHDFFALKYFMKYF